MLFIHPNFSVWLSITTTCHFLEIQSHSLWLDQVHMNPAHPSDGMIVYQASGIAIPTPPFFCFCFFFNPVYSQAYVEFTYRLHTYVSTSPQVVWSRHPCHPPAICECHLPVSYFIV